MFELKLGMKEIETYIFAALLSFHLVKWIYVFFVTAAKRHRQSSARDRNRALYSPINQIYCGCLHYEI